MLNTTPINDGLRRPHVGRDLDIPCVFTFFISPVLRSTRQTRRAESSFQISIHFWLATSLFLSVSPPLESNISFHQISNLCCCIPFARFSTFINCFLFFYLRVLLLIYFFYSFSEKSTHMNIMNMSCLSLEFKVKAESRKFSATFPFSYILLTNPMLLLF